MTLWIDFSVIHRYHNSDTLVMSLISLYQWTPLFWEQNRLGMLVPLLARPFHDPTTNLQVQAALVLLSGFGSFFLLGYYVAGRRRGMAIGALGSLWFVLAVHLEQQWGYLINNHHYATSTTLSLLALIALTRWQMFGGWWRPAAAVLLIWLALWVNISATFALGPLVLLRRWLLGDAAARFDQSDIHGLIWGSCATGFASASADAGLSVKYTGRASGTRIPSRDKLLANIRLATLARLARDYPACDWIALAATASGMLISMGISRYFSTVAEQYGFLPPREWLACSIAVLRNMPDELHGNWLLIVAIMAASALPTLAWPAGRQAFGRSLCLALGLLIPAAVQFLFMTSLDHVHRSNYPHYVFVPIFLWQGACILLAVLQWTAVLPDNRAVRRLPVVLVVLFCVVAAARWGRPGRDVAQRALDENSNEFVADVLAQRCTHVSGEYWHVWKTVYHANRRLAHEGSPYIVWGIAQRSLPTAHRWTQVPLAETRIAEIIGDEEAAGRALHHYGIEPLSVDTTTELIRVLRPGTALSESWVAKWRR